MSDMDDAYRADSIAERVFRDAARAIDEALAQPRLRDDGVRRRLEADAQSLRDHAAHIVAVWD